MNQRVLPAHNLDRKILDLNQIVSPTDREKLEKVQENSDPKENVKRISEGMLWHTRLRYASLEYLKQLQKSEKRLEKIKFDKKISEFGICILAKMESLPFRDKRSRAMGPIKPASFPGDNKFIIVFIDDYSRYARAYCVKHRNEAGKCLEEFLIRMRNQLGKQEKVCYIRADNGT